MRELFDKLSAPFDADRVQWRVGSVSKDGDRGMALAYIDARDVQDRLDKVVGPADWQCRYTHADTKTICEIGIKIGGEWVWKADGAGDTDFEASKGALSDAFKRAAVRWGVGRYLYDVDAPWVDVTKAGRSYVIAEKELPRLRRLLSAREGNVQQAPAVAQPSERADGAKTQAEKPDDALRAFLAKDILTIPVPGAKAKKPDYDKWSVAMEAALNACSDYATLNRLWGDNSKPINELAALNPDRRRDLEALADKRADVLMPKTAEAA